MQACDGKIWLELWCEGHDAVAQCTTIAMAALLHFGSIAVVDLSDR